MLNNGIDYEPARSLARVCELAIEAQIYHDCVGYYPFVLGAQPVRLIDLAAFYAAIANEGFRPSPYAIELVEQAGRIAFRRTPELKALAGGDRVAFVQLKSILQGVLARGTARAIAHLSPYLAGKTGTSDGENDAWFVGFSNDVTIGIWVGYDNADGKRRTLGGGQTGGKVAVPIFTPIMDAVWASFAKKAPISPPSTEAQRQIIALPVDLRSGTRVADRSPGAITEYFRVDRTGGLTETQYNLVSEAEAASYIYREPGDGEMYGYPGYSSGYGSRYGYDPHGYPPRAQYPAQQAYQYYWRRANPFGGLFWDLGRGSYEQRYRDSGVRERYPPQRVDPQYPITERGRY